VNGIAFIAFSGEPFRELVDSGPVKRHLHNRLMTRRVEDNFSIVASSGADAYFESIAIQNGTQNDIITPWLDNESLCFPEAVHNRSSGEVAVSVPAFDDTAAFLHVPHYLYFVVHPLGDRRNSFTIVKINCAFDGIGIVIGAPPIIPAVVVIIIEVYKCRTNGPTVGLGFVDKIYGVKSVEVVAPCIGKTLVVPTCFGIDGIIEHAMLISADLKDGIEHVMNGFLVGVFPARHCKTDRRIQLAKTRENFAAVVA